MTFKLIIDWFDKLKLIDQLTLSDAIEEKGTVLIPIPVPIFVPVPMAMYSVPVPTPFPFPVPIAVPIVIPTTRGTAEEIFSDIKVCYALFLYIYEIF